MTLMYIIINDMWTQNFLIMTSSRSTFELRYKDICISILLTCIMLEYILYFYIIVPMYSSNNYMLEFNNGLIFYSIYLKNMALNMDTDIPIIELADNTPSWDIQ